MGEDVAGGVLWYVVRNAPTFLAMFFLMLLAVRGRLRFSLKATVGMALGIVVAVKGLGRWSELRDNPGFNERFIIGTLASLTWAGTCGLLGRYALERFIWFGP